MSLLFEVECFGRASVKKNTQRVIGYGRKRRVIYSPQYMMWANAAKLACFRAHMGQKPIEGLVEAHFTFTFKNHQSESDLSNCLEGIQDVMQTTGVIKDDKQIRAIVAEKVFGGEPSVHVRLFEYEGDHG